jgi:hypothetical protein
MVAPSDLPMWISSPTSCFCSCGANDLATTSHSSSFSFHTFSAFNALYTLCPRATTGAAATLPCKFGELSTVSVEGEEQGGNEEEKDQNAL